MDQPTLTYVNIDTLKVGDEVGVCKYPSYGWNHRFRYPAITTHTIKKITPKRTKFVLDNGAELNIQEAKQLVIWNQDAEYMNKIASKYNVLKNMLYKIDQATRNGEYVIDNRLNDVELLEYMNAVRKVYDKLPKKEG